MTNKKQIEKSLKSLILKDNKEFVTMLSGEWGIGKTYFWNQFKNSYLKEKDVVYISLFGKNSLADIETEIVTKLYKYNKNLKKYTKHLDTVGNMVSKVMGLPINVSIGSLLSLFKASDFKNTIICFDDFERLSDKVSLKDVMGLISQFKEQKECKVIMILNEKELDKLSDIDGKKHDEIFALYKEKVVDYNFHYQPSQEELFDAIKEDIDEITFCDAETIRDFFEKIDLNNIRIMKQALYQLNQFSFISNEKYDKQVMKNLVSIALNLFVFKTKTNYKYEAFKEMIGYRTEKELKQDISDMYEGVEYNTQKNDTQAIHKKALKNYVSLDFIYLKNEFEFEVYTYIDKNIINEERVKTILYNQNNELNFNNIYESITDINTQYTYSFQNTDEDTSKKLEEKLLKHKGEIHSIFTYYEFKYFIDNLEKYGKVSFAEAETKQIIKNYIKFYIDNPDRNEEDFHTGVSNLDKLCDDYPWGTAYKNTYLSKDIIKDIKSLPKIIATICNERNYSDESQRQLNIFTADDFKTSIKNASSVYIDHIVQVSSWTIGGNYFEPIKSKITKALCDLSQENKEFKRKAEDIAKHAKLNLEDCKS